MKTVKSNHQVISTTGAVTSWRMPLPIGAAVILLILGSAASLPAATVALQQGLNGYSGTTDAWCNEGARHDNYGADTNLQVKADVSTSGGGFIEDCAIMKFILPGLTFSSLAGAELDIYYETAHSFADNNAMGIKPYRVGPTNVWYENNRIGQSGEGVNWLYYGQAEVDPNKWGYGSDPAIGPWNNKVDDGNGENYVKKTDGNPVQKTNAIPPLNWVPFNVQPSVQQWYGGQPNNGFLLFSSWWEGDGNIVYGEFTSREGVLAAHRPKLTLSYAGAQIRWGGYANGTWDAATPNWNVGSYAGTYGNGDFVTFADGASNPGIALAGGGVSPGSVTVSNTSTAYSFSGGSIGGSGAFTKANSGTATLAALNNYSGLTIVKGGALIVAANNALGATGSGTVVSNGAALGFQGGVNYASAEPLTISGGGGGGSGALYAVSGSNTFAGPITLAADSTIGVAASLSLTLNGAIGGGFSLTKAGSGRLALAGTTPYTYSGATLVNEGTLALISLATIPNTPVIDVVAGASLDVSALAGGFILGATTSQTLKGGGIVNGDVIAQGLGRLEPGASPGTLTFLNNLTQAKGVTNLFELTNSVAIGGGTNDLIVVGGNLTLVGNVIAITVLGSDPLGGGTYRLFNYAGSKTGSFNPAPAFLSGGPVPGSMVWIDESVTNQINLIIVAPIATTTLAASAPNPSLPGTNVTLTATVNPVAPATNVPVGSVTFETNGVPLAPPVPLVNGVATLDISALPHGFTPVRAAYPGQGLFLGSTGSVVQLVNTPPVAGYHIAYVMEDETLSLLADALLAGDHDPDGDPLNLIKVSALSTNGGTAAMLGTIKLAYLPKPDYAGPDLLTYTLADPYTNVTVPIHLTVLSVGDLASRIVGVTNQGGGAVTLTVAGIPGWTYQVQAASNFAFPLFWQTLATNTADTNGLFQFTDLGATNTESYYRLGTPTNPPDFQMYDAELEQLDVVGGPRPGMMIRESPKLASLGITRIEPQPSNLFAISSFFDVFTELSLDNGLKWLPATNGSIPLILVGGIPLNQFPDELLPPLAGQYISPPEWPELYPQGAIIKDLTIHTFDGTCPPPAPGENAVCSFRATADLWVSFDGGLVFLPYSTPCRVTIRITGRPGAL